MAKEKVIQTNFTSGELSPLMFGRVDTTRFQNGAAAISNFIVRQQGGLWFRQGSQFLKEVKDSTKKVRIFEFEFSDSQCYVLEIGDFYIRIYYDGGFVETSPGSGVPLEVVTPYSQDMIWSLKFAQSADVLYITHPNVMPQKLMRLGANSWAINPIVPLDGPYLASNIGASLIDSTLTISNVVSNAVATANGTVFGTIYPVKAIEDVVKGGTGGSSSLQLIIKITGHGLTTGVKVNISGLQYRTGFYYSGAWSYTYDNCAYPAGNGTYTVTVIDANNFFLQESNTLVAVSKFVGTPINGSKDTRFINGSSQQVGINTYFEFRRNNTWVLAKILTINSTVNANVVVLQNIKKDLTKQGVVLTVSGTTMTSDHSGCFTSDDIGYYVRSNAGGWYQITKFLTDSTVTVSSAFALMTYDYPTVIVTVSDSNVAASVNSSANLFVATDVGRHLRLNFAGKQPWMIITSYVSATQVGVSVYGDIPPDSSLVSAYYNGGATDVWRLGSWSLTTGYPKCVTFHEQRLCFGGSNTEPQAIWLGVSNDYENFAPTEYDSTVLDSSAISYAYASNKANPIQWMESGSVLLVGTLGSELIITSASGSQALTPTNIVIKTQARNGSLPTCKPIRVGTAVLFVQKTGRKLIEMLYSFQEDSFLGHNLTVVNDHILRQGGAAVDITFQKEPSSIVWVALQDGTLAAITYERDQQVAAWHRHSLGNNGFVESICSTSSAAGTEDVLFMVVRRTINGVTKRYIEYLTADFYPNTVADRKSMFFLDCGLTYSGAPTTTITGANHLTGESVSVVADGIYIGEKTVTAGTITLPTAASTVTIGYKYKGILKLLPIEGGQKTGSTAVGKIKRAGRTLLRLFNSLSFKFGYNLNTLDTYQTTLEDGMTPTNNFINGDVVVDMSMPYTFAAMPYIVQDLPYPLIILAVAPDMEVNS